MRPLVFPHNKRLTTVACSTQEEAELLTLSAAGQRAQRPLPLLTPHQFSLFFFFSIDDPTNGYKFIFIYCMDIRGKRLDLHISFIHWLGGILLFDFWLLGFYNGQ